MVLKYKIVPNINRRVFMNFVFLSPNFPKTYFHFTEGLKKNGVTTLGIGDAPYDDLSQECKDSLVEYYKVSIKYVMPEYSVYYYNQEVSIKYLDNVLNEFFGLLEGYAEEGREIPERVFTNLILNNLDSEYNPE